MTGEPNLEGAVLLNQAEQQTAPSIDDLTFVDLVGLAFTRAGVGLNATSLPAAKREYALARTHLEDAVMRFTRGRSMDLGVFSVSDTESDEFLKLVSAAKAEAGPTDPVGGTP